MKSSRRNFLQLSGAALTFSALEKQMLASPVLRSPIGIQLYAVQEPMAKFPEETLRKLRTFGYGEVECAGYGALAAKDYRRFFDEAGLLCPSAHLGFKPGTDPEPLFEEAHVLGARYAASGSLSPAGLARKHYNSTLGPDGFKSLVDWMNKLGAQAKAAGLRYAYHNHSHEFERLPDGTVGYDYMLANTDPALVYFEIDCGWMSVAGYQPEVYLKRYPTRFRMLHVKDFVPIAHPYTTAESGPAPQATEFGQGFIDYKPIVAAAKTAGIEHVFAEQEAPYAVSPMESARQDAAYLQLFSRG